MKVLKETKNLLALMLLIGSIGSAYSQTFVAMRVNVSGQSNGGFLPEASIVDITGTYSSFAAGNPFQTFTAGPDIPGNSGFTYIESTGNLTFNLSNFGSALTFAPAAFNSFFRYEINLNDATLATPTQFLTTENNGQIGDYQIPPTTTSGQPNAVLMPDLHFDDTPITGPDLDFAVTVTGNKNGTHPTAANVTAITATWEQFDTGGTLVSSESKVDTVDSGFTYDETTGLINFDAITMLQSEYDPTNFNHFFTFDVQIDDANIVSTSQLVSTGQFDVDGSGAVGGQANPVDMGTLAFSDSIATGPDLTFEATLTGSVNSSNPPDSTVKWIKATFERNDGAGTVITTETKIDTSDTGFTYDESTGLISFYAIDMLGSEYLPNGFDHTFTFEVKIDDLNLIQFSQTVNSGAYDLDGNGVVNGQANAVDMGTISYDDDPFIFNPLSGTYTIDPNGSGANNFTSFASATVSMDLNGVVGPVVFNVKPGVYQETVGGTDGIEEITGASATNTITFQNDGSGGDVVVSPVLNGTPNACVYLNGADWLIFDGIDTAPDVNSTSGYYGFYVTGGSENNEIKNCNISSAANNSSNYRAIYQTQTGGLANNSNSYHNNEVHTAYSGIYIAGANSNYDTLNTVYQNDIHDVAQHGIYFYYQKTANLWGNDIHDIGTNSLTYGMNILVSSANTTIEVHDNKIHGIAGSSGRGLHFGGSSSKKLVYNNMIYDFSTTGQNLAMFNAGASSGDEYYYNTIYINETNSTQAAYGFFNNSAQNTIFKNNIIAIEKAQGSAFGINKPNGSISDQDHNCFFIDPNNGAANVASYLGTTYQTLNDWQASGFGANSVEVDPQFISQTDPHIDVTQPPTIDNLGTPVVVTTDIDGDLRNSVTPDIGADEFVSVGPPAIGHSPQGNTTNTSNPYDLTAQILDDGSIVSAILFYDVNTSGTFTQVAMTNSSGAFYDAQIPAQPSGSVVDYYIEATDNTNDVTTDPPNAPTSATHTFQVNNSYPPQNASAVSQQDGQIPVSWNPPVYLTTATQPSVVDIFSYTQNGNTPFGFANAEGEIALKFFNEKNEALKAVQIDFASVNYSDFKVSLHKFGKGALPGELIGVLAQGKVNELSKTFTLPTVSKVGEKFFVVISQESKKSLEILAEASSQIPSNTFYFSGKDLNRWSSFESAKVGAIPSVKIITEKSKTTRAFKGIKVSERKDRLSRIEKADKEFKAKNIASYIDFPVTQSKFSALNPAKFISKKAEILSEKGTNQVLASDVTSYKIYSSTDPNDLVNPTAPFLIFETPDANQLSYTDTGLANGTTYYYVVTAVFTDNSTSTTSESIPSNVASGTPADLIFPNAPSNLVVGITGSIVDLTWDNPTQNVDGSPITDLAKIRIYRQDNAAPTPTFALIDSVLAPNTTYADGGAPVDVSYYVTSVDLGGNESTQSNTANAFNLSGLGSAVFFDSLENANNWTMANSDPATGWFVDATPNQIIGVQTAQVPFNGAACLNYNNGINFDAGGVANNGTATLDSTIDLTGLTSPTLFFQSAFNSETGSFYDQKWLEISTDNFATTVLDTQLFTIFGAPNTGEWTPVLIGLDTSWAQIQIRFRFDTIDGAANAFEGWFIDDFGLFTSIDLIGPAFSGVTQVEETDDFTNYQQISASVSDPSGVDSVWMHYRIGDTGNYTTIPMNISSGNVYLDSIPPPPTVQPTNVYYYFSARDLSDSLNVSYAPTNYLADPINNVYSYEVRLFPAGTLAADAFPGQLSLSWGQPGENGIELKYDDGTSEFQSIIPGTPPGLNTQGPGTFANKFDISSQTQITGDAQVNSIKVFLTAGGTVGSEYKVKLFSSNSGTGLPDVVLWDSLTTQATFGDFLLFDLPAPINIGDGEFFVAVEQTSTSSISLGGDTTLQPPYGFNSNTHFIGASGNWSAIETLAPIYGQIIPMIRCFVEPAGVIAPIVQSPVATKIANKLDKRTFAKRSMSKVKTLENANKYSNPFVFGNKNPAQINLTPTYAIVAYNLYKLNGTAIDANDVVTNGSVIYTGTDQFYDDTNVTNPNPYSYAVTITYDVNGTNVESDPGNLVVTTPLAGGGNPNISTTSNSLDFGQIVLNTATTQTLQIKNSGGGDLDITSLSASAPFTLPNPPTLPVTILAGDSLAVDIAVFLTATGVANETLYIGNSDASNNPYVVNLTAEGVAPDISVNTTNLDFGGPLQFTQGTTAIGSDTVTVTNNGTADLTISALNITGTNASVFTATNTTPITVTPSSTVDIVVDFGNITVDGTYTATLEIANDGQSGNVFVNLSASITFVGIEDGVNAIPTEFSLAPNYPNPFNPSTTIKFGIPEKNFTKVVIYNALGQAVKTLVSETLEASFYEFKWDGTDNNGNTVASGIYFTRMEAGKFVQVRKMTFLK